MAFPSYEQPADYGKELSDDSLRYCFHPNTTLVELTRITHLVMHSIAASRPQDEIIRAQLTIIASVFQKSKTILPINSLDSLKELVFFCSGVFRDIMMTTLSSEVLHNLLLSKTFLITFQA